MLINGSTILDLFEIALNFSAAAAIFYAARQGVIGKRGTVVDVTNPPYAMILVDGAKWRALAAGGAPLVAGETVVVSSIRGLQLAIVSRVLAGSREATSTQALPKGWRIFAGAVAALEIIHGFKEGTQERPFESTLSFLLALCWSFLASGILSSRRNLQVSLIAAIAVLTAIRVISSLVFL